MTTSYSSKDVVGIEISHDNALVVEAIIQNFLVQRILIDDGSKVNLPPSHVFH